MAKPAHAATFTVNSTEDAKDRNLLNSVCDTSRETGLQCTLRAAIQEANDTRGADTIGFNIVSSGASVKTISPASPLPPIKKAATIDGYTQPGASTNTQATGNDAVLLIELNGTNAGDLTNGLKVTGANNTIRGLVINRFSGKGVLIAGTGATGNRVEGNFIGTDAAGSADRGNSADGVQIDGAPNNTVGGTDADDGTVDGVVEARNVISGNGVNDFSAGASGVVIFRGSARGNEVQGNLIGTKADGTSDLGNVNYGVHIAGAPNNTLGGTASRAGNTISHNDLEGVLIAASAVSNNATGNKVQGNRITSNRRGVQISGVPNNANNLIGGTEPGTGNFISGNAGDGVVIFSGTGNSILSNQIFGNGSLGIGLGGLGSSNAPTANDTDDTDTGSNNLQNFPIISSAIRFSSGATTINGTLNSNPGQTFLIQCFVADNDPSGHGEGFVLIGQTTTATNANGDSPPFSCSSTFPQLGQKVTATATRLNTSTTPATPIETSEFSPNVDVSLGP